LEVSRIQEEIDGEIATYNVSSNPTLKNYPAWDFTYSIPCNGTLKCDDLRFEYTQESYAKNARSVAFNTKTHQAFRFTEDETKTQLDLRWSWQPIADSEYGYILEQLASLQIDLEGITLDVKRVEKNAITTTTFESRIKQLADSITLDVSKQIDDLDKQVGSLQVNYDELKGSVVKEEGGNKKSFSWSLKVDGFRLYSNNKMVFECNDSGINVEGYTTTTEFNAQTANIRDLIAEKADITTLNTEVGNIKTLVSEKADISELNAKIATVNSLVATKATISQLNVTNARIENIETDYIKTADLDATNARIENIEADYITTTELEAVDGKFENLNASNITTGTLKIAGNVKISGTISGNSVNITNINADNISSGKIKANYISADIMRVADLTFTKLTSTLNNATQGTISVGKIQTSAYVYYLGEEGYKQLGLQRVNIGGHEYRLLGLS
ncbi:MAG: hypothetical protein MJ236_03690, partial [Clostridia bacterium]|nr:hypothetical protein [Clostridia bacterium]